MDVIIIRELFFLSIGEIDHIRNPLARALQDGDERFYQVVFTLRYTPAQCYHFEDYMLF